MILNANSLIKTIIIIKIIIIKLYIHNTYTYVYTYVCVCIYVYTYTHTYIFKQYNTSFHVFVLLNTRDVGRTREKVQNHEPEASDFELFQVFSQYPKCLYKSTKTWKRVSYCFYKMTEHLPLCKSYLSK